MVGEALCLLVCSILIGERSPNSLSQLYISQPFTRLLFTKLLDLEALTPFLKTCQNRVSAGLNGSLASFDASPSFKLCKSTLARN